MQCRTLYRPVGLKEAELILEAESRRFPPRLPEQPIFYPVLVESYADQIARDWNAPAAPNFAGFVTRFEVESDYLGSFEEHVVGSSIHRELWIPAEQLASFNSHINGKIQLIRAFYGPGYTGPIPKPAILKNCPLDEQLQKLKQVFDYSTFDFACEVSAQHALIQLNFAYWSRTEPRKLKLTQDEVSQTLGHIAGWWKETRPDQPLMVS